MNRKLKPSKLMETSSELAKWIAAEFPESGLSKVGAEVSAVTREAVERAERIRRPNFFLRSASALLLFALFGGLGYYLFETVYNRIHQDAAALPDGAKDLGPYLLVAKDAGPYLVAAVIFLITVEFRLKRRKAIQAVHELRAMAHIIDMHQLAKDDEIERFRQNPNRYRDRIREYLHACTALLSLVSKIGELYVEHFPDAVAVAAVDQFEQVCNGLSTKIWPKIIALSPESSSGSRRSFDESPNMLAAPQGKGI